MSQASEAELLMLELINQERTSRGIDPLTINNDLNEAAEDHSKWMLNTGRFQHEGVGGSTPGERIAASDYPLEGSWRTAENIGWQSERGEAGILDDVADIHESLMNSPNHRRNLLNPELENIGIGIERGDFQGFDGVLITQNFGRTDAVLDTPAETSGPVVLSEDTGPQMPVEVPIIEEVAMEPEAPTAETLPEQVEVPVTVPETPTEDIDNTQTSMPETTPATPANPDNVDDDSEPEENNVTTTTTDVGAATVTSSGTVTEMSEPKVPAVDTTDEGVVATTGSDSNEDETVTEADGGESPTDTSPEFDLSALFERLFDRFDFGNLPKIESDADDVNVVRSFQGSIATNDRTMTTDDPVEFDMMLADMFTMTCSDNIDFG